MMAYAPNLNVLPAGEPTWGPVQCITKQTSTYEACGSHP